MKLPVLRGLILGAWLCLALAACINDSVDNLMDTMALG